MFRFISEWTDDDGPSRISTSKWQNSIFVRQNSSDLSKFSSGKNAKNETSWTRFSLMIDLFKSSTFESKTTLKYWPIFVFMKNIFSMKTRYSFVVTVLFIFDSSGRTSKNLRTKTFAKNFLFNSWFWGKTPNRWIHQFIEIESDTIFCTVKQFVSVVARVTCKYQILFLISALLLVTPTRWYWSAEMKIEFLSNEELWSWKKTRRQIFSMEKFEVREKIRK